MLGSKPPAPDSNSASTAALQVLQKNYKNQNCILMNCIKTQLKLILDQDLSTLKLTSSLST